MRRGYNYAVYVTSLVLLLKLPLLEMIDVN